MPMSIVVRSPGSVLNSTGKGTFNYHPHNTNPIKETEALVVIRCC